MATTCGPFVQQLAAGPEEERVHNADPQRLAATSPPPKSPRAKRSMRSPSQASPMLLRWPRRKVNTPPPVAPNAKQQSKSGGVRVPRPAAPAGAKKVARNALSKAGHGNSTPSHDLSPMKDRKKQLHRKLRHTPQSAEKLGAMLCNRGLPPRLVQKLIDELFHEQEADDRELYRVTKDIVKAQTCCNRSKMMEELGATELRRVLTYGEVSVKSISQTVLPLLRLEDDDVFYDLGCGTGKIVVQVALETPCSVAKGIELMKNRVDQGAVALQRLKKKQLETFSDKDIRIVHGDICEPPREADLMDATVIFINNVCFGPELMLRVMAMLEKLPKLKRVVTLRKLCERHRHQKCMREQNYCVAYVHPPKESQIHVSWADKTSVYLYERVEQSVKELAMKLNFGEEDTDCSEDEQASTLRRQSPHSEQ